MRRSGTGLKSRKSQSGQVLMFALIAMLVLLLAILFLFDIHTVVRGKVKGQTAVDAAAMTGATWQLHTLNLAGELNLVKATSVLITEPEAGLSADGEMRMVTHMGPPDSYQDAAGNFDRVRFELDLHRVIREKQELEASIGVLSQMQTRVAFVLPLAGFGAAQQAAKNNGITANMDAGETIMNHYYDVLNGRLYGDPEIVPQQINGYSWRLPYAYMLRTIVCGLAGGEGISKSDATGIAVATKENRLGTPILSADAENPLVHLLGNKSFFDAVLAESWCKLRDILGKDFSGNWWGDFSCEYIDSFAGQSELLNVNISFFTGGAPGNADIRSIFSKRYLDKEEVPAVQSQYEQAQRYYHGGAAIPLRDLYDSSDPYLYKYDAENGVLSYYLDDSGFPIRNPADTDLNYNILPEFTWCVYNEQWIRYGEETKRFWESYLQSDFKTGYDYYSGAAAYFEMEQPTKTLSGQAAGAAEWAGKNGSKSVDDSVFSGTADRLQSEVHPIQTFALAKPFGRIQVQEDGRYVHKPPFAAGNLVLPVFTEVALIPVALEPQPGYSQLDREWLNFITMYVPLLAESQSLEEQWQKVLSIYPEYAGQFRRYHRALLKLRDPDFHRRGQEWLETPIRYKEDALGNKIVTKRRKDTCDEWRSGGSGVRRGPPVLH